MTVSQCRMIIAINFCNSSNLPRRVRSHACLSHDASRPLSLSLRAAERRGRGGLKTKVGVLNAALGLCVGCFFQLQNRLRSGWRHKGPSMHHFLQPSRGEWRAGRGPPRGPRAQVRLAQRSGHKTRRGRGARIPVAH